MAAPSEAIGRRIQFARERLGISGTVLAELLGYARPKYVWWRVEAGRRGLTPDQLGIIAKRLNVTTDWLIYGAERRSRARRAA